MTLTEYLSKHPTQTIASLAAKMDMHRGHLHKIATGERGFNSKTAQTILSATNGLVTPNDLMRTRSAYLAKTTRRKRVASGGR
jgi:DNA-binding transcriptional regulator YdaS (Cro superfamily)